MAKIEFDKDDLAPLIEQVVAATIDRLRDHEAKFTDRMGYGEGEAASLLGIPRHSLRDCRRRGEVDCYKIGSRIFYTPDQLKKLIATNRL